MTDCPFCLRVDAGETIHENDHAVEIADKFPVTEGHTLVIPRRHTASWGGLTRSEQADMLKLLRTAVAFGEARGNDGFNIGANIGKAAGQTIEHIHIHVIPRRRGDTPEPRGGVRGVIPERASY